MTDTPRVVVPYSDFLQRRDQRRRIVSELARRRAEAPAVTPDLADAGAVAVARALPLPLGQPSGDHEPKR